jgi:Predicted amidohydrolase
VASFPASRIAAWTHLLRARAIENQTFTIGVNRIGQDGYGTNYNGQSTIIQYDGDYLIEPFDAQALKIQVIDKTLLDNFRNKFPFLKDDTLLDLK